MWPAAPGLTSSEVNNTLVVQKTTPRLTNTSCNTRYQGIPTTLSNLAVTRRYQHSPTYRRSTTSQRTSKEIYRGDTNTPIFLADSLNVFNVSFIACPASTKTYLALVKHCTLMIFSLRKRTSIGLSNITQ